MNIPADITEIWENLAIPKGGKIVYVVLDGVGGLPDKERGGTELQVAATAKIDPVNSFDEYACIHGSLGTRPGTHLMGLALANAGRLQKFGA